MPNHFEQILIPSLPRGCQFNCCVWILFLLSAVAQENVSQSAGSSNASDEILVLSNVTDQFENDNSEKMRAPPVVEVFHGKMNSVAHDLLAGIEEMPPLATEVFPKDADKKLLAESPVNNPTLELDLPEDNVTGVDKFVEQTLLINPSVDDNGTTNYSDTSLLKETPHFPDLSTESNNSIESTNLPTPPTLPPPIAVQTPLILKSKENESEPSHDDIPSFSEWANKKMAEAEKNKGENLTVGTTKLRLKNYASPDCGAKVVAANPEATSPSAILSPSRDDYMLNPCNIKIWFAVELCESIQPQRIEIANFELFSSSPQNLSFWVSDRYPTRDWTQVATVEAKDERNVQSFPLPRLAHFAKYVKVELHSHYGSEHYCPISLFKAYGTSELEVLDNSDSEGDDGDDGRHSMAEEDNDSLYKLPEPSSAEERKPRDDLFHSAKAAVMSIVQKAAQVLGNGSSRNNSCSNVTATSQCLTPGYQIVCSNCTDHLYYRVYDILCCNGQKVKALLTNTFIYSIISKSLYCSTIGLNLSAKQNISEPDGIYFVGMAYLQAILGDDTLAALCNYLAITQKKVALPNLHNRIVVNEGGNNRASNGLKDVVPDNQLNVPTGVPMINELQVDVPNPNKEADPGPAAENLQVEPTPPKANVTGSPVAATSKTPEEDETSHKDLEAPNTTVAIDPSLLVDSPPVPEPPEGILEFKQPSSTPPPETVQQPFQASDETLNADSIALDSLLSELEEETPVQEATTKPSTAVNNSPPVQQKESVFVRLANRIKVLEVNMSLSSQYLEELSRRYKKQVEELQRTLASMIEDRRLAAERETAQGAQIVVLTQKMEALTVAVTQLLEERNQWLPKAYVFGQNSIIIMVEIFVLFVVMGFFRWLFGQSKVSEEPVRVPVPQRRHSLDGPSPISSALTLPKVRRPSEEALIPSSSTNLDLLINGAKRKTSREGKHKRKRKRKEKTDDGLSILNAEGEDWIPPSPEFMQTAQWSRCQRMSIHTQTSSSQETLGSLPPPSGNPTLKKKTGALKKFVKKLF